MPNTSAFPDGVASARQKPLLLVQLGDCILGVRLNMSEALWILGVLSD